MRKGAAGMALASQVSVSKLLFPRCERTLGYSWLTEPRIGEGSLVFIPKAASPDCHRVQLDYPDSSILK